MVVVAKYGKIWYNVYRKLVVNGLARKCWPIFLFYSKERGENMADKKRVVPYAKKVAGRKKVAKYAGAKKVASKSK